MDHAVFKESHGHAKSKESEREAPVVGVDHVYTQRKREGGEGHDDLRTERQQDEGDRGGGGPELGIPDYAAGAMKRMIEQLG